MDLVADSRCMKRHPAICAIQTGKQDAAPLGFGMCPVDLLFAPTYFVGIRKTTMRPFSALIYTILI
jgi:hypothetical protein